MPDSPRFVGHRGLACPLPPSSDRRLVLVKRQLESSLCASLTPSFAGLAAARASLAGDRSVSAVLKMRDDLSVLVQAVEPFLRVPSGAWTNSVSPVALVPSVVVAVNISTVLCHQCLALLVDE